MAKITIEFDEVPGMTVEQPAAPDAAPSGGVVDGGAAPSDDALIDAPALAPFDRSASDAHDAGGPPAWLNEAMEGVPMPPDAPPVSGDAPIDGGGAPEE